MGTFNAGAIEARLTLDRSSFTRELKEAQAQAKKFSDDKITPELELKGAEEIKKLEAQLKKLGESKISPELEIQGADEIRKIQAQLDNLDRARANPHFEINGNSDIQMLSQQLNDLDRSGVSINARLGGHVFLDLTALEREVNRLDGRSLNIRTEIDGWTDLVGLEVILDKLDGRRITLDIDIDKALSTLLELQALISRFDGQNIDLDVNVRGEQELFVLAAEIAALDGSNISINVDADGGAGGGAAGAEKHFGRMQAMVLGILVLLPLVAPVAAVATAGVLGLAAGLTAAAGGMGVLALGVGPTVMGMMALREEISKQQTKLQGLKEGTKDYNKTLSKITESQKNMVAQYGAAGVGLDGMANAYEKFTKKVEPKSLDLLASGFGLIERILPSLTDIFDAFAPVMGDALESMTGFVGSDEWDRVMSFFTDHGPSAFKSLLSIGGNLMKFFGRLFEAFAPFGEDFLDSIDKMTASWAEWVDGIGKSEGFKEFIDYVRVEGPKVWDLIVSMCDAIVNLGVALAPLGSMALDGFTKFFDMIANTDPGMLGAIVVFLGTATIGVMALAAASAILNVIMNANPISLVVIAIAALAAGLIYAYNNSEQFRSGVDRCWSFIQTCIGNAVSFIIELFRRVIGTYATVIGALLSGAASIAEALHLPFAEGLRNASNEFNTMATNADNKLKEVATGASHWGEETGANYNKGLETQGIKAKEIAAAVAKDVKYGLSIDAYPIGVAVSDGLARGIRDKKDAAIKEAQALAAAVAGSVKYGLVVNSPSKLMIKIGHGVGDGLGIGMHDRLGFVEKAALRLARSAVPDIRVPDLAVGSLGGRSVTGGQREQATAMAEANTGLRQMLATTLSSLQDNTTKQPLVGGNLVLQAAKDDSVESQFDAVMFRLRATKGAMA